MELKTGTTVVRVSPTGEKTEHILSREQDVKYHTELQEKGFSYSLKDNDDWLEAAKPTLRIHKVKQECLACEG